MLRPALAHPPTLILCVHTDENTYIHSCILNTAYIAITHHSQWAHTVYTFEYLLVLGTLTLCVPREHYKEGTETNFTVTEK